MSRKALMKPVPMRPFNKYELPQLPTEIWIIIFNLKKEIEAFEASLTDQELIELRQSQGWTRYPEHIGDWIDKKRIRKIEDYNKLSFYKRLLFQLGMVEYPELDGLDPKRAAPSAIFNYTKPTPRRTKSSPRITELNTNTNGGSIKKKRFVKGKRSRKLRK